MNKGYKSLNQLFSKTNFIGSYSDYRKIPIIDVPEFCFIGRSNVGKSSLINQITKVKNLAKTSKTPGRTQAVNLFLIDDKIILADLPGYGFSKFSKNLKDQLTQLINQYFINRKNLKKIFLLIDCKLGIKSIDLDAMTIIGESGVSFSIILTKIDKCIKNYQIKNEKDISNLLKNYPSSYSKIFSTSIIGNQGIVDVQKDIYGLIQ